MATGVYRDPRTDPFVERGPRSVSASTSSGSSVRNRDPWMPSEPVRFSDTRLAGREPALVAVDHRPARTTAPDGRAAGCRSIRRAVIAGSR